MPTPRTTTMTETMTGVLKCLPSQKRSTAHTNGMFISFMICTRRGRLGLEVIQTSQVVRSTHVSFGIGYQRRLLICGNRRRG